MYKNKNRDEKLFIFRRHVAMKLAPCNTSVKKWTFDEGSEADNTSQR